MNNGSHEQCSGYRHCAPLIIAGICLAAGSVRTYRAGHPALYNAEAFGWRVATGKCSEIVRRAAEDVHPPGSYVLLKYWIALWGVDALAIRSLSILSGLLCVPLAYVVSIKGARLGVLRVDKREGSAVVLGGVVAASLFACHPLQVDASRIARMYGVGSLLTLLCYWCLFQGLQSQRSWKPWVMYALCGACGLYMHYFFAFTIAAQLLFVVLYQTVVKAPILNSPECFPAASLLGAAGAACVLFSPWLPQLLAQLDVVQAWFWIPKPTTAEIERIVQRWALGVSVHTYVVCTIALACIVAIVKTCRARPTVLLFALAAAAPWLAFVGAAVFGELQTFQERYLTFGQVSVILMWASLIGTCRHVFTRWLVGVTLCGFAGVGLIDYMRALPVRPAAADSAMTFMRACGAGDDVVVAPDLGAVNILRYYATHHRLYSLRVRHPGITLPVTRHQPHLSSLSASDFLWPDWESFLTPRRVWIVNDAMVMDESSWRQVEHVKFRGDRDQLRSRGLVDVSLRAFVARERNGAL